MKGCTLLDLRKVSKNCETRSCLQHPCSVLIRYDVTLTRTEVLEALSALPEQLVVGFTPPEDPEEVVPFLIVVHIGIPLPVSIHPATQTMVMLAKRGHPTLRAEMTRSPLETLRRSELLWSESVVQRTQWQQGMRSAMVELMEPFSEVSLLSKAWNALYHQQYHYAHRVLSSYEPQLYVEETLEARWVARLGMGEAATLWSTIDPTTPHGSFLRDLAVVLGTTPEEAIPITSTDPMVVTKDCLRRGWYQAALAMAEKLTDRAFVQGEIYWAMGEWSKAETAWLDALQQHKGLPSTQTTIAIHGKLAGLYDQREEYSSALLHYQVCLQWYRTFFPHPHAVTLAYEGSLGFLYERLEDYPRAEQHYQSCFEGRRGLFGIHHPSTLAAMVALGDVYAFQRKRQCSIPLLEEWLLHQEGAAEEDVVMTKQMIRHLQPSKEEGW